MSEAYTIKKVTPRALRTYNELGFLDTKLSNADLGTQMMSVYMDLESLKKLLEVTFVKKFNEMDVDNDVDLALVAKGVQDFLGQLSSHLGTSSELKRTLIPGTEAE